MNKRLFSVIVAFALFTSLKGQVVHEIGIGFSGLKIWEPEPPGVLNEDLDYYWNPQVSYQLHFLNERIVAGLQFGWVYAKGLKDEENYFREDLQKSINLDVEVGANLFRFKNSFIQWTAGVRLTKTYLYSREMWERDGNRLRESSGKNDTWQDINYDLISTILYQLDLSDKRYIASNLALRFSLEMVYFFPVNHKIEFLEQDYRFAMGPSVSLIWRLRGKENRGLF